MLSQRLQDGLNELIQRELFLKHLYCNMTTWTARAYHPHLRDRMHRRSVTSENHARTLLDYMSDRGAGVGLPWSHLPRKNFTDLSQLLQHQLEQEQQIISFLKRLYTFTAMEKDRATQLMIERFIQDHVSEETWAASTLTQVEVNSTQKSDAPEPNIRNLQDKKSESHNMSATIEVHRRPRDVFRACTT